MAHSPRVAVITGASRGIGAGLVVGYRKLGYAVVANSRTITASDDLMVLTVGGDIAQPGEKPVPQRNQSTHGVTKGSRACHC
jgi:NAD(P)-dependent dehydrogenase (short-subunit alcohol dehydrogenase family)